MHDEREAPLRGLEAYAAPEPPADLADRIAARTAQVTSSRRRWRRAGTVGAIAVAVALAVVLWPRERMDGSAGALRATGTTTVHLGERASATAAGGADLRWQVGAGGAVRVEQRAGSVRYRVRSGPPFRVITDAATVEVVGTEFTVEVVDMKRRIKAGVSGALVGAAITVAVYEGRVLVANEHGRVDVGAGQRAAATSDGSPEVEARAVARQEAPVVAAASEAAVSRFASPEERAQKLDRITRARLARLGRALAAPPVPVPVPSVPPTAAPIEPAGAMSKQEIQAAMQEVRPLIIECYQLVLEDTPELDGRVEIEFLIAGEPEVGGLVEEAVVVSDDALSTHPIMSECLAETILSLEFPPPEHGGQVRVRYPFVFAPR